MLLVDAGVQNAHGDARAGLLFGAVLQLQIRIGPVRSDRFQSPLVRETRLLREGLGGLGGAFLEGGYGDAAVIVGLDAGGAGFFRCGFFPAWFLRAGRCRRRFPRRTRQVPGRLPEAEWLCGGGSAGFGEGPAMDPGLPGDGARGISAWCMAAGKGGMAGTLSRFNERGRGADFSGRWGVRVCRDIIITACGHIGQAGPTPSASGCPGASGRRDASGDGRTPDESRRSGSHAWGMRTGSAGPGRDGSDAPVSASRARCQEQAASSRGALRVAGFPRAGRRGLALYRQSGTIQESDTPIGSRDHAGH